MNATLAAEISQLSTAEDKRLAVGADDAGRPWPGVRNELLRR